MNSTTLDRVVACIASATRYPSELLNANADLESDLGIDSVKLLEIVMALSDEFGLHLASHDRDASIRTIEDMAVWIEGLLTKSEQALPDMQANERPNIEAITQEASSGSRSEATGSDKHWPVNEEPSESRNHGRPSNDDGLPSGANGSGLTNAGQFAYGNGLDMLRGARSGSSDDPIRFIHSSGHSQPAGGHTPMAHDRRETTAHGPLSGRVALVTGSGRGVGRTTARLLASRGATVIVNSFHSRERGEQTVSDIIDEGGRAVHYWGSVANPSHVEQIFAQIEQRFGRLDILVCNASDGRIGPFMDLTAEDWERAFRTNVVGHHHCAKKAAPLMRAGGGGSIITLSAVGSNGYIDGLGSQGVVKAAVETMTRYLACELGPFGIRVNCVVGGPVYGDLLSKFSDARMTQNHWESMTADRELCSPLDLANAIGFLVSEEARGVNGSVWVVDHGFSAVADGRTAGRHVVANIR
jgi:enoyl-[acyl-carrier protein] reductase III